MDAASASSGRMARRPTRRAAIGSVVSSSVVSAGTAVLAGALTTSLFLQHLPVRYRFHGFSNLVEISTKLADQDLSKCDVVVSFGYALLQVRDNRTALSDFARLITCVLPAHSCIVVAADARNDAETRAAFAGQCDALRNALIDVGVSLEERLVTTVGSIMFARLKKD